jgi:sugar lactone lactonase YvrE
MHTRETLGVRWRRSAAAGRKLALWLGIALLMVAALPSARIAVGFAASQARPNMPRPLRHARASALSPSSAAFVNGQAAGLVLGQADFTSSTPATTASGMFAPDSVALDPTSGKLFVADFHNNRVLRFASAAALTNGAAAEGVLGQPNFTSNTAATSVDGMRVPIGVAVDSSGRLWVVDHDNSRVLRFDAAASKPNGANADGVLGQSYFVSGGSGGGSNGMSGPIGVAVDASGRLWVGDTSNNRVLRFDSAAGKINGAAADGVLGQTSFTGNAPGTNANGMYNPQGVAIDGAGRLWVADSAQNRVLRFDNAAGKANGANADGVLGQTNFIGAMAATTAGGMNSPDGLAIDTAGRLWVTDFFNSRVLRFDNAAGKANGANADGVLGQPNFTSNTAATTASGMNGPGGVAIDTAGYVWVADNLNNRVLRFDGAPLPALSGRVVNANGSPFTSGASPNPAAGISATSFDGSYSFANLASDGTFSLALEAGIYEVSIWLDGMVYPSVAGPAPFEVNVKGATPIGDIALVNRNVTVSGTVTMLGTPAAGVPISAWDAQGQQFSATTNGSGQYSLALTPGEWEIAPDVELTTNYIFDGASELRELTDGQSATINFLVEQANGTISGTVVNQSTSAPATDAEGWAYVTRNGGEGLKWAPISNGSFSIPAPKLNAPTDVLRVGLYLDPNSNYSSTGEIVLNNAAAPNFTASVPVQPHDAVIAGQIYLADDTNHTPVTQVSGQVVLTALDDSAGAPLTKSAPIDPATGRYSVNVLPGSWLITYQLESDLYQADLSTPISVTAVAQQISIRDLPLTSLDGFITAEVRDQDGVPQPNVTVWARYGSQEIYAETDSQGLATLYVPYSSVGAAANAPGPLGQLQPPLKIGTSYSSCNKPTKPEKPPSSNTKCKNSSPVLVKAPTPKPKPRGLLGAAGVDTPVALGLRDTNTSLAGRVLDVAGQAPRADAFVSAWSSNGQWISASTDSSGAFSLPIRQDSTISATWQISASYWDAGAKRLLNKRVALNVPAGSPSATPIAAGDLTLEQIASALPPSESQRFDNGDGISLRLSDGTLIQIPQSAMPDGFGSAIRITVDPRIELPSTDLNRLAVYYGYTINLYDAQTGRPITQPLKRPATISFSYSPAQLQQLGVSEESLQPAQFADDAWHVPPGFLQDTQGQVKTISFKTTSLDNWALVSEQPVDAQAGGARVYVPMVRR